MANILSTNPLQIDTTGVIANPNNTLMISGIKVVPSGTTWTCILQDGLGNVVFHDTNTKAGKNLTNPFLVQGLTATTLTSITRVLIYLAPSQ